MEHLKQTDIQTYADEVHALYAFLDDADAYTLDDVETLIDDGDYLVLDDGDADEKAEEYIRYSVWAFNANFIACHCPDGIDEEHITALRGDSCEDVNEALIALIDAGKGMEHFMLDAIGSDGRGHFISFYDGEEHEVTYKDTEYYIYRIN